MRVTMLTSKRDSINNGLNMQEFHEGQSYEVPDDVAKAWIDEGAARREEVEPDKSTPRRSSGSKKGS